MRSVLLGMLAALLLSVALIAVIGPPQLAAQTGPADRLRAMVYAGDIKSVVTLLDGAGGTDRVSINLQRELYAVFTESHPAQDQFTQDWLLQSPGSPQAMTARAWALFGKGWTLRGDGPSRHVAAPALAAFGDAEQAGLDLALRAIADEPGLVAASDAILKMAAAVGRTDLIGPELDRIMAIAPNRGSILRAAAGLSPQWGGSVEQMHALCAAHAIEVPRNPPYTPETCEIDVIFYAEVDEGPALDAARASLAVNRHPALDYARQDHSLDADLTAAARLARLDEIMAERPLTPHEAQIHDADAEYSALLSGKTWQRKYPAAVARALSEARREVDRNPGSIRAVVQYQDAMALNARVNNRPYDNTDIQTRLRQLLLIAPYSVEGWIRLGLATAQTDAGLDGIVRAEPYFTNAVIHSNHSAAALSPMAGTKLAALFNTLADPTVAPDPDRFAAQVTCPFTRQLRLLTAACTAEGKPLQACAGWPWDDDTISRLQADIEAGGRCAPELSAPLDSLRYTDPVADLTAVAP